MLVRLGNIFSLHYLTEKLFGKRASAICDSVDPKLEVDNLYSDVLEKFAIKYNLHLI